MVWQRLDEWHHQRLDHIDDFQDDYRHQTER
jgi:hypothetical protein